LLAGGSASYATKTVLAAEGAERLAGQLSFFGLPRARLIASRGTTWEDDPWARGGYAFFDASFPPSARRMLALPWKRVFFAGEHKQNLARVYERRRRKRTPRRRRAIRKHQIVERVAKISATIF